MQYIALFRGLNVGGKNIIKMDGLKQLFHDLGFLKVKTYIQSGNVIFESLLEEASLQDAIYTGFTQRFGFESGVTIRSIDEMGALIDNLSISPEEIAAAEAADPQVEHLYVYFLDYPPKQPQIENICKLNVGPDILRVGKRELYILCYQSIRKSKLATAIAKKFDSATVRNFRTVNKLYDMLNF